MALGRKLKTILQQKNMTVKELSEKIEVPATTLYSFINRDSQTGKLDLLTKICNCLDITMYDLVDFNEGVNCVMDTGTHFSTFSNIDTSDPHNADIQVNEKFIIYLMSQLNDRGQEEAVKRVEELTEIKKYQRSSDPDNTGQ